jgi:ABC-2 type transport system permease protein
MNIFLRELRANFKSLLIWCLIVVLFTVVGYSKFSAFYGNPELLKILDAYPPAMIEAAGLDTFNLTTVTGFFGVMVAYFGLILSIAAAMWGSDIILKETRDKTVEFSLTLPVTRTRLVTAKIAAAGVNCLVLLLVTWGVTLAGSQSFEPDQVFFKFVPTSMLVFALMQLIFLALGIFLGCAIHSHKKAGSLAVTLILASYVASILTELSDDLAFLNYISPFNFFDPAVVLRESHLDPFFVGLSLAISAIAFVAAYIAYNRRDLYI